MIIMIQMTLKMKTMTSKTSKTIYKQLIHLQLEVYRPCRCEFTLTVGSHILFREKNL